MALSSHETSSTAFLANNKTKNSWAAFCHAFVYSLPFLLIGSALAFVVILSTHFFIDRFRLARYVCWIKNFLAPWPLGEEYKWSNCSATGYPSERPAWLAVWLLIIADNTLHLIINYLSLKFL